MAKTINFSIKLQVDGKEQLASATANVKDLKAAVEDGQSAAKKAVKEFSQFGVAVFALGDSVNKLQGMMQGLAGSYQASAQANTQLTTVMRQRMLATDEDIAKVKETISAQKQLGVIGGVVQMRGAQQIATFLTEKQTLNTLIPAMNNLLAQQKGLNATQEDAYGVANLMGKAMQGQTSALKRVGITFTDAEAKVMQFGTEQERAAMLAQIITNNVGEMNAELGKTEMGKQKQLENQFAAIKVKIGEIAQQGLPFVAFAAQSLNLATSLMTLGKGVRALWMTFTSMNIVVKTSALVASTARIAYMGLAATGHILQAAFTGATIGATTLKVAIRGLLITTGVGVAIAGLTMGIEYLMNKSEQAAGSVKQLSVAEMEAQQAQQQMQQQISSATSALETNIAKLKDFHGTKTEEKKLVAEMNETYGQSFGYYSTVSQWYQALIADSKSYCAQIELEAQVEARKNKIKQLVQKQYNLTHDEKGNKRTYRKTTYTGGVSQDYIAKDGHKTARITKLQAHTKTWTGEQTKGYQDAEKGINTLTGEISELEKKRDKIIAKIHKGADINPSTTRTTSTTSTPTTTTTNATDEKPAVEGSMKWYSEQIEKKRKELEEIADEETAKALNAEMEGLQRSLYFLKIRIGVETPPPIEVQKKVDTLKEEVEKSLEDIQKDLETNPIHVEFDAGKIDEAKKKYEDFEKVQSLGNVDLSSYTGVADSLETISKIADPTTQGLAGAGTACAALGSTMQQLGSDSEAAKAGLIMAALGQLALSLATAMNDAARQSWITWLAFGISGTAQLISMVNTISGFATGGIVGGTSTSGDKIPVRVNSGEMILNRQQQARLFSIADGKQRLQNVSLPEYQRQEINVNPAAMMQLSASSQTGQKVELSVKGRRLVGVIANETRISSRSGRRTNIQI
jgi:hypothetical protein